MDRDGNRVAQKQVNQVFEVCDRKWRGVGSIPKSGYELRYEFRQHDAKRLFDVQEIDTQEPAVCISGQVLKGIKKPHCPAFGKTCTPEHPLGATMVSSEGACAAYYAYTAGTSGRPEEARQRQMLTIACAGEDGGRFPELADFCFIVPSYSIHRIQEVHATLVHIAWDLIHIALGAEDLV